MMTRVELQQGYVLHSRAFRDSSLIVTLFTQDFGRIDAVAKGARRQQKKKVTLQPFTPMLFSWQGKSELKNLIHYEIYGNPCTLAGKSLYSALYINELLVRLLQVNDAHSALLAAYEEALLQLGLLAKEINSEALEPALRRFEFFLLKELGYEINFNSDAISGADIQPEKYYSYQPEAGFILAQQQDNENGFFGADILSVSQGDFSQPQLRRVAKSIARHALQPLLGGKPLQTRELFRY